MSEIRNEFIQTVEKPTGKVIIKRGNKATDYWSCCEEVGFDVWGLLTSIKSISDEPVCLWLPEHLKKPITNEYRIEFSNQKPRPADYPKKIEETVMNTSIHDSFRIFVNTSGIRNNIALKSNDALIVYSSFKGKRAWYSLCDKVVRINGETVTFDIGDLIIGVLPSGELILHDLPKNSPVLICSPANTLLRRAFLIGTSRLVYLSDDGFVNVSDSVDGGNSNKLFNCKNTDSFLAYVDERSIVIEMAIKELPYINSSYYYNYDGIIDWQNTNDAATRSMLAFIRGESVINSTVIIEHIKTTLFNDEQHCPYISIESLKNELNLYNRQGVLTVKGLFWGKTINLMAKMKNSKHDLKSILVKLIQNTRKQAELKKTDCYLDSIMLDSNSSIDEKIDKLMKFNPTNPEGNLYEKHS